MSGRTKKACATVGCHAVTTSIRCDQCDRVQRRDHGRRKVDDGFYRTPAWRTCRAGFLASEDGRHLTCCECAKTGRITPTVDVDHIIPRHDRPDLAFDFANLQGLCKRHHSQKTAREDGGFGHRKRTPDANQAAAAADIE